MITLYGSGPNFGLPDASPFVTKAETLLRMMKLPFERRMMSFSRAPKKKIPYIDDDGLLLGDSTFIRWHIEQKYGVDLDAGLTAEQRATAWAFEKMAEDNLYWAIVHLRWVPRDNFERGPKVFFSAVPAPARGLVIAMVRWQVKKSLYYQGMGRHSQADVERLGTRSIEAIADYLGDKPFFLGEQPTAVDATMFAFVSGALCPVFTSPVQQAAWSRDALRRYVGRMTARFFPDFEQIAGCDSRA